MIDDEKRKALINYRIEQAKTTSIEAKVMIDSKLLRGATNRIYYSMFYMVMALALKNKFETSKHTQLIGWFNKNIIKEEKIERRFGKILKDAFDFRQQGDYASFQDFQLDEIQKQYSDLLEFMNALESYILNS